jgi:hypothetical protein
MNRDELLEQLNFYRKLVEEQGDIIESLRNSIDEMHKDHKESQSYIKTLLKQIADLTEKLDKALATIGNLEQKLSDYDSRNNLNNQHRFGSRSQKGITPKKLSGAADRTEQKDSFSVPEDIQDSLPVEFTEEEGVQSAFHGQNALGPHKRMEASRKVFHKSDKSRIPAGATFMGYETRKTFDEVHYIVATLSMLLHETLRDEVHPMGDLMLKALHYLQHFWNQLFAYLKDGLFSIDNNIAERSIRPMTVERKNSLMFGSHKGAEMSAIFHTFIETCKMNGISTIEYFKKLLSELLTGNNNYASLLPQTIGIKR